MKKRTWPYWTHDLTAKTTSLTFDAEQASALAHEIRALLEAGHWSPRIDELHHRLTFDADYLRPDED